jgi:RNA polymerase sigma factor (TIGR02999 family)
METLDPAAVTGLLKAWTGGDRAALDRLIPVVYQELRRMARRYMRNERAGHSLQTTALVNEVYLRLVDVDQVNWQDRTQFFAMCSTMMRRILVDGARARRSRKRGGGMEKVNIDEVPLLSSQSGEWVVALDAALNDFAKLAPRPAQVLEMRYFGGLREDEIAAVLKTSTRTIERHFHFAKTWLMRELSRQAT